jgi:two-component system nitrogen regulation response regulator GlnG
MTRALVIDDDHTVLHFVRQALARMGIEVLTADSAEEGWTDFEEQGADVILLDIMLPKMSGLELAAGLRERDAKVPIIFITAADDSETAIAAMKVGAFDYLRKPLDVLRLQSIVQSAIELRHSLPLERIDGESAQPANRDGLVGCSPQMLAVYKEIGRVAARNITVLIRGESGTGKELVARAIYHHSHRGHAPFMAVNCAALSETLLESELFGHERGAFTGAVQRKIGKFEQSDGGTLFLDEVGDMSWLMQSKVLRILQEQQFERVGGAETIHTDVRIISATNSDLRQMVEQGKFRLDLFHRLNGFEILLPPLRERGGDIEILLLHFLPKICAQLNKNIQGIAPEALDLLRRYAWPGNIRELQNILRWTILRSAGSTIIADFLPPEIVTAAVGGPALADDLPPPQPHDHLRTFIDERIRAGSNNLYLETVEYVERCLLLRVLREARGNQSRAAQRLGITRSTLRNKIRALRICINQIVESSSPQSGEMLAELPARSV